MKSVEHVEESTQTPASYRLPSTSRFTHHGKADHLSVSISISKSYSQGKEITTEVSTANYRSINRQLPKYQPPTTEVSTADLPKFPLFFAGFCFGKRFK